MNASTDPQTLAATADKNSRVQVLNDLWLLTIVAVLVGTGLPWLANNFQIRFAGAGWGLLALGGAHVMQTLLGARLQKAAAWHMQALVFLDIVGVMLLGFIWDQVGALQNPLFLMVFVLPIIGAFFLKRWLPYLLAAVSIVTVFFVSLREAPELRWFASGLLGGDFWLTWLFGRDAATPDPSFSGFSAPLNYLVVLLEVFSVSIIACAIAAEYVGTLFGRLDVNSALARGEAARGEQLWASLINHLPQPALLIDLTSTSVIAASHSATEFLRPALGVLEGRNLYEVLKLSYPEIVQELLVRTDAEAPSVIISVGSEFRLTRLRVAHVMHKDRRLALLSFEDRTEIFCIRAALDTAEYASLVVDAKGRVMAFNKPLSGLLGSVELGMDAAPLIPDTGQGAHWWEPGLTGRRKMHMQVGSRIYQLTAAAIPLPGEDASIFTVAFLPVAVGALADPDGANSAITTGTLRQLR